MLWDGVIISVILIVYYCNVNAVFRIIALLLLSFILYDFDQMFCITIGNSIIITILLLFVSYFYC